MEQAIHGEDLRIVTPEQVRLRFRTAGVGSRAGAHAIDLILLGLSYALLFVLVTEIFFRTAEWSVRPAWDTMTAIVILIVFASLIGYFVICECTMGQTVGGRIVGLRVLQDNGRPVTVLSSFLRNLLRIIDILPFGYTVGLVVSFLHPQGKRLGDLLAGTVVIYDQPLLQKRRERKKGPIMEQLAREGWTVTSFVLNEEQRKRITRQEWTLLKGLVERRNEIIDETWTSLTTEFCDYLLERLEIASELAAMVTKRSALVTIYAQAREDWEL